MNMQLLCDNCKRKYAAPQCTAFADGFIDKKIEQFFQTFEVSNDRYLPALHVYPDIKKWLCKTLEEALEEGSARRGGAESEQKKRMFEAGRVSGRLEGLKMALESIPFEISLIDGKRKHKNLDGRSYLLGSGDALTACRQAIRKKL